VESTHLLILSLFSVSILGWYVYAVYSDWESRLRAGKKHQRRLELEGLQHKQRLELAQQIDTTIHVLVADKELACTFDERLAEAMQKADIPRVRVEPDLEDDEDDEAADERSKTHRRKKRRKSG
jgi:hypothetical protein